MPPPSNVVPCAQAADFTVYASEFLPWHQLQLRPLIDEISGYWRG